MLATLVDQPFSEAGWLYEIKWDGYRAIGYVKEESVKLLSRNNLSFADKYTPVSDALKALNVNAVFDGEIVAVNERGLPDFQLLQNHHQASASLQYALLKRFYLNRFFR